MYRLEIIFIGTLTLDSTRHIERALYLYYYFNTRKLDAMTYESTDRHTRYISAITHY